MPLPILEKTVAEMNLAPHEHTKTVEFLVPQFINQVVVDRVTTQIQVPQSRWKSDKSSRESLTFDSETKVVDSSHPTENRQQRTDAADAVPESSKKERDTLNQAGRAWNIECLQCEIREIIFPASIKKAMEMQAEAEVKETSRSTRLRQ